MSPRLAPEDVLSLLVAIATLLASARLLGEIARRFRQPSVLGEILAGVLLGPTVLGSVAPSAFAAIFPQDGAAMTVLDGLSTLSIVLFLLIAGIEVDLSMVWRQGKVAMSVGALGLLAPFGVGFAAGYTAPTFFGLEAGADPLAFSLFFAAALSISALSVITKTLLDLYLYRSDVGVVIVAAAILDDLFGWIVFAIILGMIGAGEKGLGIGPTVTAILLYAGLMLSLGRILIDRVLPWLQAYAGWPGGVLTFATCLALFGAAYAEWIGVHPAFGSFIAGVALGDSRHLRERTRAVISEFVSYFFAPLFFASIGLRVNFAQSFDPLLVLVVLVLAFAGKITGCALGARLGGMPGREALAVGFGMSARGSQEIILGLLALQFGLIREPLFVALVVMALVTSMMSGPLMARALRRKRARRLLDFLSAKGFVPRLQSTDRAGAILELTRVISAFANLPEKAVNDAVWWTEQVAPTGLSAGLAVPHARIEGLKTPVIGLGLSPRGIDFDAADGQPAHLVFFILTPKSDDGAQVELLADIARTFSNADLRERAMRAERYTEFRGLLQSAETPVR